MAEAAEVPNRVFISSMMDSESYRSKCEELLGEYGEVRLSALGMAINSLVGVVELLKQGEGTAVTHIKTSIDQSERRDSKKVRMDVVVSR